MRIALSHAIDVENMMESLLYGQAERMGSPFPRSLWTCDKSLEPREFEPDIAEEMLAGTQHVGFELGNVLGLGECGGHGGMRLGEYGLRVTEEASQVMQRCTQHVGFELGNVLGGRSRR